MGSNLKNNHIFYRISEERTENLNIEYFKKIEQNYRTQLNPHLPIIVRFDGKNVTKDHKRFHLLQPNGFTDAITSAAIHLAEHGDCAIYSYLDEVSVIFLDAQDLFSLTEDYDLLYSAVMILQIFKDYLPEDLKKVKFNVSVFNIPEDQCFNYILYRRHYCEEASLVYYAKEYFPKNFYHRKNRTELFGKLLRHGHDEIISPEFRCFFKGRLYIRKGNNYEEIKNEK